MASIREKLEALEELQKVDLEILAARKTLDSVPVRLKELTEVRGRAHTNLEAARVKLTENDHGRAKLERSVQDERDKVKKWEGRLNELKTTAQYAALAREVDISRKQNKTMEDEILELMAAGEELRKAVVMREAELRRVEADTGAETKTLEASRREAEDRTARLEAHRAEVSTTVDASLLSRYENIRKRRLGVAVARVSDGRCTACNMSIPQQLYNTLRSYSAIEPCPHCGRIIYAEQSLEAPLPQA